MTALTPEQRRTALCQTLMIYQDARFAVRPLAGACERHIPLVRKAITKAFNGRSVSPVGELIFIQRLQAVADRLETARLETLAMIMDVCETMHLDQMTMAAALKTDAVLPAELKMNKEQVEGPLSLVLLALQEGLEELAAAGDIPQRTIDQTKELLPIMKVAGGKLLQHVSTAAWAARACKVITPYAGTPRLRVLTPMATMPAIPAVATAPAAVRAPAPLPDGITPPVAVPAADATADDATRAERPMRGNPQGPVDVEAYFERKRRRAAGE